MIPEADAARLFSLTLAMLGPLRGRAALAVAGQRTGAYILAHRIPRAAQAVLRGLPARVAAPLMRRAIRRAAWTFAGSGRCLSDAGEGPAGLARFTLQANPLPLPGLPWHAAVFGTIFRALVDPRAETTVPCAGRAGCGGCDRQGCAVLVTRAARRRAGTPARRP
jgi:divinyl protochlorophyllide a 8-vinyl-reductase